MTLPASEPAPAATDDAPVVVRALHQALLWPLRLIRDEREGDDPLRRRMPWQPLLDLGAGSPWRPHEDEYTGEASGFHERHYNEFVAFLPYVQRFLYGEGRRQREAPGAAGDPSSGASPMRVFRRHDVAAVRLRPRPEDPEITLQVVHVDLYFFYGVDVVLLNVELAGRDLALPLVQELLYRSGRAYPGGWRADGRPQHSLAECAWLDAQGQVLARSDAGERDAFLAHVAEHRAPRLAAHWSFMLAPLVNHHDRAEGVLRFRQIEYYRMPVMAWLAVDDPARLSRADFIRLGLVTGAGESGGDGRAAPYAEAHLADFEARHCFDRFWSDHGAAPRTRYLCSGHALIAVGDAANPFFTCRDRGVLAQFRHQHFILFLIAHFQKATLLMTADQLAEALTALNPADPDSVRRFKRRIRRSYVEFLGFTHRYWFRELSEQAHVKALYRMCQEHLELAPLYVEVKERIHDMSGYLEADGIRRQANTVVRLTVVTIFGLIGTITTGFLGMNLLAESEAGWGRKLVLFLAVFVPTVALTFYTMAKSKRLSDFLDAVSDERMSVWQKARAFLGVWR